MPIPPKENGEQAEQNQESEGRAPPEIERRGLGSPSDISGLQTPQFQAEAAISPAASGASYAPAPQTPEPAAAEPSKFQAVTNPSLNEEH